MRGETFYSQNLGRPYLREAIASYLTQLHQKPFSADQIAVAGSGVSALMLAAQLLLEPGDRVVAVTPLWPNVVEIPRILGATIARVGLTVRGGRWALDIDRLIQELTPETRLLVLNSPNNPTGWTIGQESILAILAHCRRHGIWILVDEVYERLIHDQAVSSAPSFLPHYEAGDRLISVNSFSKAWSMTGWRVGWICAPEPLMQDLAKLIEYNTSCVAEPTQRGALAALEHGEPAVSLLRSHLRDTRKFIVDHLESLPGVEVPAADGAMYVFFQINGYDDSMDTARQLLRTVGLGLAPGSAFGPEGNGWLRWCHAVSQERLNDGVQRLKQFLSGS